MNRLKWFRIQYSVFSVRPSAFGLQPKHLACLLLSAALLIPSMTTSASAPSSPTDEVMADRKSVV